MVALLTCLLLSIGCPPVAPGGRVTATQGSVRYPLRPAAWRVVAAPNVLPSGRPARGRLLVASPQLIAPIFARTVILLVDHGDQGSMGVVLNRPTEIPVAAVLQGLEEGKAPTDVVRWGGPVAMGLVMTLVRAAKKPDDAHAVFSDVYVTGSRDALRQALAHKGKGSRLRVFAGHAGWAPGQLQGEIDRGDWLVTDADASFVFDRAAEAMWPELMERLSGEWAQSPPGPAAQPYPLRLHARVHALVSGARPLTRDQGFYWGYFPRLRFV